MKKLLLLFVAGIFFFSCGNSTNEEYTHTVIDCPADIAYSAFKFAELYSESDTEYTYGGQDPLRAIKIDCSGLVIMCYKYAMVDTKYSLLLSDMSSDYMYRNATTIVPMEKIRRGDLIFMGEDGTSTAITHIALFDRLQNGKIYFIDSTLKNDKNGVSQRYYQANDSKFKAFGIMRIQY